MLILEGCTSELFFFQKTNSGTSKKISSVVIQEAVIRERTQVFASSLQIHIGLMEFGVIWLSTYFSCSPEMEETLVIQKLSMIGKYRKGTGHELFG